MTNSRINKLSVDILEWDGEWKSLSCDHADYRRRLDGFGAILEGWATPSGQPAGQALPGANKLSPPFGDHQAQGRAR